VRFGRDTHAPATHLASLHGSLLPDSPVARLGRRFMEDFYYRVLPRAGLLFGAVAYVEHQPVGFVAATRDRAQFLRRGMRRFWPRLLWTVGAAALIAPTSLASASTAWRVMRSRRPVAHDSAEAEILSLGVLPDYREPSFIRRTGLTIGRDLLGTAVDALAGMGVGRIAAVVNARNTEAKLFYAALGWRLHRRGVPGWGATAVEFVWCDPVGEGRHVRSAGLRDDDAAVECSGLMKVEGNHG
jgi:ribosomal protein S18 acetylase RimI-like enzyme